MAEQGIAAYQEGRYPDAVDLLQRAETLYHAPVHVLFLARAFEREGKLVQAREHYMSLKREKLASSAPEAFIKAQKDAIAELNALEPRVPYALIRVQGMNADNATVSVNGEALDSVFVGVSRPMNPGQYVVEATADGARAGPQNIDLAEGAKAELVLEMVEDPNAVAPVPDDPAVTSTGEVGADAGTAPEKSHVLAYTALAVGALGVVLGVVFTLQRSSKNSDADKLFDDCLDSGSCGSTEVKKIKKLDSDAASSGTMAVLGYGVGVAGIGVGLALLLTNSDSGSAQEPVVRGYVGPAEIGLTGTF
jgi:hypothetical protein